MQQDPDTAIAQTRRWIESVVIELGLCPFAEQVLREDRLRFSVSAARDATALLADLDAEVRILLGTGAERIDTTLLIHPHALGDFLAYNDFLDPAEALLRGCGCEGVLQLASFHPDYRFEGAEGNDPASFTNRSPYPMLHLLREASVSRAVDSHPDVEGIPAANAARLRELGWPALARRLQDCGT